MKKLLLIFIILLLTASFDEIGRETRFGKFLEARSIDSFLASVSFWLNDNDDNVDNIDNVDKTNADKSESERSKADDLGKESTHSQTNVQEINNTNKVEEENTSLEIEQSPLAKLLQDNADAQKEEKQALEDAQKKQAEEIHAEQANESDENKDEITKQEEDKVIEKASLPEHIVEIKSELVELNNINVKSLENSYQAAFTIINKSDAQQNGKILFYLIFEDNTRLAFDDAGAIFRTRYQVDKNYTLPKTAEIKAHLENNKAKSLQIELVNTSDNTLLLKKNVHLEN